MNSSQGKQGMSTVMSDIPDHGVHAAGRFRSNQVGTHAPRSASEAHNFGESRVSFGYDPSKPHADRMRPKQTSGRHGMIGVMDANQSAAISVQQWRCAMVRNRNANCMKCAAACTSGCISVVDDRLHVDASRCVGCGTCATVCPTCAIESHNPTDAELFDTCVDLMQGPGSASTPSCQQEVFPPFEPLLQFETQQGRSSELSNTRVVIACRMLLAALGDAVDASRVAEVVCLGRVDESLIVGLAGRGATEVVLACGCCSMCEQAPGLDCAKMVVDTASELLSAWDSPCAVRIQEGVPDAVLAEGTTGSQASQIVAEYFAVPRANAPIRVAQEDLLDSSSSCDTFDVSSNQSCGCQGSKPDDSAEEDALEVLKVMKDGTLPHFVPARRERLLDALFDLGAPKDELASTRLWGRVTIDPETCVSCRMCAVFCPTGAIVKYGEQDSDDFGVEHVPGDCVNCGTCEAICPQNAITISNEVCGPSLLGGEVHRFAMLPRAVALGNTHQIVNTMRFYIAGDIFER